jgi:hypothetical protein
LKLYSKNDLEQFEKPFVEENFNNTIGHEILEGSIPVLVSAPHSVPQLREGKYKQPEYRTGVLAQILHNQLDCYTIYKTKNNNDDANYDPVSSYKNDAIKLINNHGIKYLIDLHIMSQNREFHVDIGTARGRNINNDYKNIEKLIQIFHSNNIYQVEIDRIFTGAYPHTVSSTIWKNCHIPAIQLEINWVLLDFDKGTRSFHFVLKSLMEYIEYLIQIDGGI